MRIKGIASLLVLLSCVFCNPKTGWSSTLDSLPNIYLLPGQGADERLFDSLSIDNRFEIRHVNWVTPPKHASMKDFAHILSAQIDTTAPFILIGTSLGGMVATEMCDFLEPEKVILISSAKSKYELPKRYTFQRKFGLYKAVPPRILRGGAKMMQPLVEPDRNKNKETFKAMLREKELDFMKRSIHMIATWDKENYCEAIIHIHGENDHTVPIKNVKYDYLVENGSHMITLTRGSEVSVIINNILRESYEQ